MLHILLVLHLLLFMFSFAFTAGFGVLLARVSRSGDAKKIHAVFSAARPLNLAGGVGWILTALTGIALAIREGMPLSEPWLIYSYAAFAVLILNGFLVHRPQHDKVIAASANGPSPELDTLLKSPANGLAGLVSGISVIALVYLMTSRMG
jgi:uncharacterized membrane protein